MTGRIDMHCHLLPGVDDGCTTAAEALMSIRRLIEHGYRASICTPHIWPELFPANTPDHIVQWTRALQQLVDEQGIDYRLIPGGELRMFKGLVDWFKTHGVPTLGDSNLVLFDFWENHLPRHADKTIGWLLDNGYQPVLAHPERLQIGDGLIDVLDDMTKRGVLLQGNFLPFTGLDVACSDMLAWRFLDEGRYAMLALDLHRPDTLEDRLRGLALVEDRIGSEALEQLVHHQPWKWLNNSPKPG